MLMLDNQASEGMLALAVSLHSSLVSLCRYCKVFNGIVDIPDPQPRSPFDEWREQEQRHRCVECVQMFQ